MATVSSDYQNIFLEQPEHVHYTIVEQEYTFLLQNINLFETNMESVDIIDGDTYDIRIDTIPRKRRPQYAVAKEKTRITRPRWAWKISLFKDWRADNDTLIAQCFETDWECGKYNNFIKSDEDRDEVKELMRGYYNQMR